MEEGLNLPIQETTEQDTPIKAREESDPALQKLEETGKNTSTNESSEKISSDKPVSSKEALGLNENGERQIEQKRVHAVVQQLGEFYNLPAEKIAKAAQVPVFLVAEERFVDLLLEGVRVETILEQDPGLSKILERAGFNVSEMNEKAKELYLQRAREEFRVHGGLHTRRNDETNIFLNTVDWQGETYEEFMRKKMRTLRHESLHELASKEMGGSGFQGKTAMGKDSNEAATQILEIAERHPDATPYELLTGIQNGVIETTYVLPVTRLLAVMAATQKSERPIDIQELASFYFKEEDSDVSRTLFMFEVLDRVPDKFKGNVESLLKNLNIL